MPVSASALNKAAGAKSVEGKKTLGYELAEQLDWKLPDAVLARGS